MFWVHFYHWLAVILLGISVVGILGAIIRGNPIFMILFIIGFPGAVISMVTADKYIPVQHCIAKPGDTIVWGGHQEGKYADWWVFIATPDTNKFCEVHNRELYNMGNGYKLAQAYGGVLVNRP